MGQYDGCSSIFQLYVYQLYSLFQRFTSARSHGGMFRNRLPGRRFMDERYSDAVRNFIPFSTIAKQVEFSKKMIQPIKMIWRS